MDGLRVVTLSGSPYELGRQHGELLREEVRASVRRILGYFRGALKVPVLRSLLVNGWLDRAWRQARPFVPAAYLEELRGLSDGSGVPLAELARLHAVPDRTYTCANLAAWGRATREGRLIHVRNLDWNIGAGAQEFAVVFLVRPSGKRAFLNVGWAGFIGVLTGINEEGISIGEIGAETVDASFKGEPMAFLMRRVLEEADDLEQAGAIIQAARRTMGINYIVADAKARDGLAIETTHRLARVFRADDPAEHTVSYARPVADAVFRADPAVDPAIRDRQTASHGDPRRPGLEVPGGSAYTVRYLEQAAYLNRHYGGFDAEQARAMAKTVAPDSNMQSVVFAWPDVWIANAEGTTPAAHTRYRRLDAEALLTRR